MNLTAYFPTLEQVRRSFSGAEVALSNRDLTRVRLSDTLTLSVPVEGGASALKRLPFSRLRISDHGRWTSVHDRALEATYGRTPFFRHLYPHLRDVILNHPEHIFELNETLDRRVSDFISLDTLKDELLRMIETNPQRIGAIRRELSIAGGESMPFFAHVCRLGPDAIFLLAPTL